jgi:hypothetical protein
MLIPALLSTVRSGGVSVGLLPVEEVYDRRWSHSSKPAESGSLLPTTHGPRGKKSPLSLAIRDYNAHRPAYKQILLPTKPRNNRRNNRKSCMDTILGKQKENTQN